MSQSAYTLRGKRVWVAGHRGLVGSALVRRLQREGCEILTVDREQCDLRVMNDVEDWFRVAKPHCVILAAATVGGIYANASRPAEFIYDNIMIEANVIESARQLKTEKLLFLGSSCIYPRDAPQPISESALLTGPLEPTNEWYAIAKIAGLKCCQAYRKQFNCDFVSVMPTNLYGPGDNFDRKDAHVIPGLIGAAHRAKEQGAAILDVWGTGRPRREFLHVDDAADAMVFVLTNYSDELPVNIGTGHDLTIAELAQEICDVVGFDGSIRFDPLKPDGTPRKVLDVSRLRALGWQSSISLKDGLDQTFAWYLAQQDFPKRVRA
jgi:GDP-L-fucose synthase